MKPFREFYLDKFPDAGVYPWAVGRSEPRRGVMAQVAEACADYMDELRKEQELGPREIQLTEHGPCPWCGDYDQHLKDCAYKDRGTGSMVPNRKWHK